MGVKTGLMPFYYLAVAPGLHMKRLEISTRTGSQQQAKERNM